MKRNFLVIILGISMFSLSAQSRFPVVQVYSGFGNYLNEPSICINPKNLNQLDSNATLTIPEGTVFTVNGNTIQK